MALLVIQISRIGVDYKIDSLKKAQKIYKESKKKSRKYMFIGIQRDTTIADKMIYILNDDTQNYPFCRLQLARLGYLQTMFRLPLGYYNVIPYREKGEISLLITFVY